MRMWYFFSLCVQLWTHLWMLQLWFLFKSLDLNTLLGWGGLGCTFSLLYSSQEISCRDSITQSWNVVCLFSCSPCSKCGTCFLGDGVWEQDKSLFHSRQDFPLLCHPEGNKWAWWFWGLHDSPGLHTLHHTQRETARKWVPFCFWHLYLICCPVACSSCQDWISQVSSAGFMSLSWHSITQLRPLQHSNGDIGHTGLAGFQCITNASDCNLKYDRGSGEQQDCPVTLSSGNRSPAVAVAINGLNLERFYKLAFINAPFRPLLFS